MPLSISVFSKNVVAVEHNFLQNGDLMCDPQMVFYTDVMYGYGWIPLSITQHPVGIYHECTYLTEGGSIQGYVPAVQKELAQFANDWAKNIKHQTKGAVLVRESHE
jgi:hypothetical protein